MIKPRLLKRPPAHSPDAPAESAPEHTDTRAMQPTVDELRILIAAESRDAEATARALEALDTKLPRRFEGSLVPPRNAAAPGTDVADTDEAAFWGVSEAAEPAARDDLSARRLRATRRRVPLVRQLLTIDKTTTVDEPDVTEVGVAKPQREQTAPTTPEAQDGSNAQDAPPHDDGELQRAKAHIEELQAAILERAVQRDAMRDELAASQRRIQALEEALAEREQNANDRPMRSAEECQELVAAAQVLGTELTAALEQLDARMQQIESAFQAEMHDTTEIVERLVQREAMVAELSAERSALQEQLASACANIADLEAAIAAAESDGRTAEVRRVELDRMQAEIDARNEEASTIQTRVAELRSDSERAASELQHVTPQLKVARADLNVVDAQLQAARAEHAQLRDEATRVAAEREEARAQAQQLIQAATRNADALREQAQEELAELAERVAYLRESEGTARRLLPALVERIDAIEQLVSEQRRRAHEVATSSVPAATEA